MKKKIKKIGLHEPKFTSKEIKYVKEAISSTWVSTSGNYIDKFEYNIKKFVGTKYAIACINGTVALQISLLVSGVSKGDEVIAPSITFIAPINAIKYNNAEPIFMDANKNFNIDESKTIKFINEETIFKNGTTYNKKTKKIIRAIIIVHVFGFPCEVEKLVKLCKKRNIKIIEDASESLGSKYKNNYLKNRMTGNIGDISCISFNGNKIITSGSGGIILTNNKRLADRARYLIFQAKDNSLRYIHNDIGYNYSQTNIQAALGLAQLEKIRHILKNKRLLHEIYCKEINNINGLSIIKEFKESKPNYWLNILKVDKTQYKKNKEYLLKKFHKHNIFVRRPVWQPNHLQKK